MPPSVPRAAISFSPFPIGESPFRVKGVLYQGTQAYFAKRVKGGMEALLAAIEDPPLRAFIGQRFLAASYYDVLPVYPLIHVEARVCSQPLPVYLRQRGEWQAEQDISGVYKVMLKLASPEAVAARLPRLVTQILNFGSVQQVESSVGVRSFTLAGMPGVLVAWYMNGLTVYAQHALRLAGARTCQVTMRPAEADGQQHGVDVVRLRFDIQWT